MTVLLGIVMITISCEKDKKNTYSRQELIGEWILEKERIDTTYENSSGSDTTIYYNNQKWIIDESDTLYIKNLDGNIISLHYIHLVSPDTLCYDGCPIGVFCQFIATIYYKITELDKSTLVLHRELTISGGNIKVDYTRYYKK